MFMENFELIFYFIFMLNIITSPVVLMGFIIYFYLNKINFSLIKGDYKNPNK